MKFAELRSRVAQHNPSSSSMHPSSLHPRGAGATSAPRGPLRTAPGSSSLPPPPPSTAPALFRTHHHNTAAASAAFGDSPAASPDPACLLPNADMRRAAASSSVAAAAGQHRHAPAASTSAPSRPATLFDSPFVSAAAALAAPAALPHPPQARRTPSASASASVPAAAPRARFAVGAGSVPIRSSTDGEAHALSVGRGPGRSWEVLLSKRRGGTRLSRATPGREGKGLCTHYDLCRRGGSVKQTAHPNCPSSLPSSLNIQTTGPSRMTRSPPSSSSRPPPAPS